MAGDGAVRTVVVGASSGLGRCIGVGLAHRGGRVALLARRHDRLENAAKEAGDGALAIACDVTDEASCRGAIDQAALELGGIDALVYAPGIGNLSPIEDTSSDTWQDVFATNVIGASITTAAALPHLEAAGGVAMYLSSVSTSETPAWPGLGSYLVSKAALDKLVEAWRAEHPTVAFTRVVVGDCGGGDGEAVSGFADSWDGALAGEYINTWITRGYMSGALLDVQELVSAIHLISHMGPTVCIRSITVAPRQVIPDTMPRHPNQGDTP